MQCQRCGLDIPNGELFCPKCGQEIQLVPDYNSVEYMIQQKRAEEEQRLREEQERLRKQAKQEKKEAERKKKKRKKLILITAFSLLLIAALSVGAVYYIQYKQEHSYDYQYGKAYEAYQAEDYITAAGYVKRALELEPDNDNAILLSAEAQIHIGNIDNSTELFKKYIEKHPDAIDAYARLIEIYETEQRYEDIKLLMDACNNDIVLTQFAAYIPAEVHIVTEPGDYTSRVKVELEYSGGVVYYTTDGTDPTNASEVYTEPVMLEEGDTTFKAIACSEAGIFGEVVSAEYTVTLARPNPPFVSPASGDYESGAQITVIVPEGCKAYYAFDSIPNSNSDLYTEPVTMPDGEHIFSVILVDENGKQSYPASETYVVE